MNKREHDPVSIANFVHACTVGRQFVDGTTRRFSRPDYRPQDGVQRCSPAVCAHGAHGALIQPKEVRDIKQFIEIATRKDASCVCPAPPL
jgi:hypothetical protein